MRLRPDVEASSCRRWVLGIPIDGPKPDDPVAALQAESDRFAGDHEGYVEDSLEAFSHPRADSGALWQFEFTKSSRHARSAMLVVGDFAYTIEVRTSEEMQMTIRAESPLTLDVDDLRRRVHVGEAPQRAIVHAHAEGHDHVVALGADVGVAKHRLGGTVAGQRDERRDRERRRGSAAHARRA